MTKDEALKMALEALKDMNCGWRYIRESHGDLYGVGWDRAQEKADDAIKALRQALDQLPDTTKMMGLIPSEWAGLEEPPNSTTDVVESEKPVAWSVLDKRTGKHWYTHESKYTSQYYANLYSHRESDGSPSMVVTPLYTAPPKREWQGLTDEELRQAYGEVSGDEWCLGGISNAETFYDIIEANLKEKNRD